MPTNIEKYKSDFTKLVALGKRMQLDFQLRVRKNSPSFKTSELAKAVAELEGTFEEHYQRWFTEAYAVLRQLAPDRLQEFDELYRGDGRRRTIDLTTYNIQDWLNGMRATTNAYSSEKKFEDFGAVVMRFNTQLSILQSIEGRFESSLFEIRQLVQADLFDSELDAARQLNKHGFLRGAGAIAGVVLEKHLTQVAIAHNLRNKKKSPTINDLNELLKNGSVIDVPGWRQIQRFGDIRNLCDHSKHREPTTEEVSELIDGVEKVIKTLF